MVKWIGSTVAGFVAFIAWAALTGDDTDWEELDSIPKQVWDGNAATLKVDVEVSHPARLSLSFYDEDRGLTASQNIEAGNHTFEIKVPAGLEANVDLTIEGAQPGASYKIVVHAGQQELAADASTLEEPLREGWVFGTSLDVAW